MSLRPSSLPFLTRCGGFRSTPGSGYPAQRGTLMDKALRSLLQLQEIEDVEKLTPMDLQAIKWAEEMAYFIAEGKQILANESECHLEIPGMPDGGTADAIIPDKQTAIDLKTGLEYDYEAQMAAYALGCMCKWFADEWTMVVLFADKQEIIYYHFNREQCMDLIQRAADNYTSGARSINQYCKWCANFEECNQAMDAITSSVAINWLRLSILERDPDQASLFLRQMAIAKEFEQRLRDRIKASGREIPGYIHANAAKIESANAPALAKFVDRIDPEDLFAIFSNPSAKSVKELLKEYDIKLTPEEKNDLFTIKYRAGALRPGTKRTPKK